MTNANYKLGGAIKNIRVKKGLKAKYVAEKMQIHPSTLSKYESDQRNINGDQLPMLAAALGCSVSDFFEQNVGVTPKLTA
jgi:transcriptional regulator with XRE-family HTH domain